MLAHALWSTLPFMKTLLEQFQVARDGVQFLSVKRPESEHRLRTLRNLCVPSIPDQMDGNALTASSVEKWLEMRLIGNLHTDFLLTVRKPGLNV